MASGTSLLAHISKGQTRAHTHLTRDLLAPFYMHCPSSYILHPASGTTGEMIKEVTTVFLSSDEHKTFPMFYSAWFAACRTVCTLANDGAHSTIQYINYKRPASQFPHVWSNAAEIATAGEISMSVGAYDFVLMKVRSKPCSHISDLSPITNLKLNTRYPCILSTSTR